MKAVHTHALRFVAVLAGILLLGAPSGQALERALRGEIVQEDAELRLRASPRVSFAPAEILFVGEIRGGPDDNEELYCASVEWDWDDDTVSASTPDCDPYEPGVTIRRRFSIRHKYEYGGRYQVRLHLKRRDDIVISARTRVEVRGRFR